jgi:Domain of unknown function (DUF6908)
MRPGNVAGRLQARNTSGAQAMKNVSKIIEVFGGMDALKRRYIRLENEPYMRLVIEAIGTGPRGLPLVSVAHNGEQNEDAMQDPEMTFEIDAAGQWHPITFQNAYTGTYQVAVWEDADRLLMRPRLVAELKSFARSWNKNIGEQGFVEVARKLAAARVAAN